MSPAQTETPDDPVRRPGRLRVLVVDDEPDTVITLLELLRDEGYDAAGFSHPMEALKGLRDYDPDVVISDIAMPVMSGWDFARKVRQKMGDIRPMLVAISGVYRKSADQMLASMAGYEHFLPKPCDPNAVLSIVAKARGVQG
jgi:CheY-like chemotaxis protein